MPELHVHVDGVVHREWTNAMGGWFISWCGLHYEDPTRKVTRYGEVAPQGHIVQDDVSCLFCITKETP